MINKLRKKVFSKKMQNGGINRLPMPPSSPNVPQVYNQSPLFSMQGLRQRYEGLPGFAKKTIGAAGRTAGFLGLRNPYMLSLYGLSAAAQNPTISNFMSNFPGSDFDRAYAERMAQKAGPPIRAEGTLAGQADLPSAAGEADLFNLENHFGKDSPASSLEQAFPGMSTSEIIESMNKNQEDSGIKIAKNAEAEVINNALENDQMETLNVQPPDGGSNNNNVSVNTDDAATVSEVDINEEYKSRDDQKLIADQMYFSQYLPQAHLNNRTGLALQLDNAVRDIMGPESKRSKNLLLLQLAANMISNRTDQPGFKGFMDVLGQSGQQVIPMAMALETQRRDDELELKKAMLKNMADKESMEKFGIKDKIARFKMPGDPTGETITASIRTGEKGTVLATITDRDGDNPREIDITNFDYRYIDSPDAALIDEYNNKITQKVNALRGTQEALKISMDNPDLIASKGTVMEKLRIAGDVWKSWTGETPFEKFYNDLNTQEMGFRRQLKISLDKGDISEAEYEQEMKDSAELYKERRDSLMNSQDKSNALQLQAKLRTIELLTSYALANLLKNEDRLAVQDIKRAEQATKQFGFLTSPQYVIARYVALEKQLTEAIQGDIKKAMILGIKPDQIIDYKEGYSLSNFEKAKKEDQFRINLKTIFENEGEPNKMFNELTNELFAPGSFEGIEVRE
tara:strand:+ start:4796 stop:6847 length:2052 start_codon:yes stop_codon:yes gene_type:complete